MPEGRYVYAISRSGSAVPAGLLGLNDAPLTAVPCRDLAAVTSALDFRDLCRTVDEVLRHEAVVEAVRAEALSLPVRFGTVLAGTEAVERELLSRYESLVSDLDRLGDAVELGVVVLWKPADPEGSKPPNSLPNAHLSGASYLRARQSEYRRESTQRERARALADDLHVILGPHALDHRLNILPTVHLALRATYLVRPEHMESFRAAFQAARSRHPGLRLLLSGPWPPYSFVSAPARGVEPAAAGE